jgi:hypothetical protein
VALDSRLAFTNINKSFNLKTVFPNNSQAKAIDANCLLVAGVFDVSQFHVSQFHISKFHVCFYFLFSTFQISQFRDFRFRDFQFVFS